MVEPLFSNYLFCYFDSDSSNWPAIRWAPGIKYFLGVDGAPTSIPDELVNYIRRRVNNWNEGGHSSVHLNPGDRLKVTSGPFAGLDGIFQRYVRSQERCRILLHMVGQMTAVELEESNLATPTLRL